MNEIYSNMLKYIQIFLYRTDMRLMGWTSKMDGLDTQTTLLYVYFCSLEILSPNMSNHLFLGI
jgi:hypothetical protein